MSATFPKDYPNSPQTALPFAVPPGDRARRLVWFVGVSHAGEHFGLSAIFLALGTTAALAVGLVVWFGSTLGAWFLGAAPSAPSTTPLLPTSQPRSR